MYRVIICCNTHTHNLADELAREYNLESRVEKQAHDGNRPRTFNLDPKHNIFNNGRIAAACILWHSYAAEHYWNSMQN